jgi:hypothetical protein
MAELFVFTILAAVVTFYSVLPDHRQLRTQFAIPRFMKWIFGASSIVIVLLYIADLYLETASPAFSWYCGGFCLPARFWIGGAQVAIVTLLSGYAATIFLRDTVPIHNDRALETRIRNLFATQQFNTLSSLLEDNYVQLLSNEDESKSLHSREAAKEVLTARSFMEHHTELNPSLATRIITDSDSTLNREVFAREYLKALHSDSMSLLYHEVEGIEGDHGDRKIPESSLLLDSLFDNAEIAIELQIWNPIRESVKSFLRRQAEQPHDEYIDRPEDFSLSGPDQPSHDPILVGIELFDLFASQALRQDTSHHIFLHYLAEIVEEICSNFQLGPSADATDEFPNAYGYLLKHTIAVYRGLVTLPAQPNPDIQMGIKQVSTDFEDDLLKNAVWGFVRAQKAILLTDSIPDQFKKDVVNNLVRAYIKLGSTTHRSSQMYLATLHKHILNGSASGQSPSDEHLEFLDELHTQMNRLDQGQFALTPDSELYRCLLTDIDSTVNTHQSP